MMSALKHNLAVVFTILSRDFKVLKQTLLDKIINTGIIIIILSFIFIYLIPTVGFGKSIGPVFFVGSFIATFAYVGFIRSLEDTSDLKFTRFIDYRLTFPIDTRWLLVSYIASYCMQMLLTTLPLLFLGPFLLGSEFDVYNIHVPYFLIVYALTILFFSSLFVCITFLTSFMWFRYNIWSRVLMPLNFFGCMWYSWYKLYSLSKPIGLLVLLNPYTYITEALRYALLSTPNSIPFGICMAIILAWTILIITIVLTQIYKKIDAV